MEPKMEMSGARIGREPPVEALPKVELDDVERPTFRRRLLNHLKRFWWIHLIIFVLVTLMVILLL